LGLRYARWALDLDPAYEPAQTTFIALAVEKAMERGGLEQPLSEFAPDVHDLLATVYPGALITTLDRALVEKKTPVTLGIIRALGERAEVAAARGERGRPGVLVKALDYPDRRVQFAAAEALLRLPATGVHAAHARIVEVLRRVLAADAESSIPEKGRILVGAFRPEKAQAMADAVRTAGFEVETVATGKELMRRLKTAADVDAIILDSELPYPPLPDTIASLRYDVHLGLLPVRIVYTPDLGPTTTYYISGDNRRVDVGVPAGAIESVNFRTETRLKVLIEGYRQIGVVRGPLSAAIVQSEFTPEKTAQQSGGSPALSPAEKKSQSARAIEWLRRMATGEVPGFDVQPAESAIRQAMKVDELALPAIVATSRLRSAEAQADLASVTADGQRAPEIRLAAADGLIRHISRHGIALNRAQAQTLMDILPTLTDPNLRSRVAAVVGSLQLTSPQSGQRMQRYVPPLPKPSASLDAPKPQ
jgi:CheY-like chemotaxis protein